MTEAAVVSAPDAPTQAAESVPLAALPDGGQRLVSRRDAAVAAVLAKRVAEATAKEPVASDVPVEPPVVAVAEPAPAPPNDAALREARLLQQVQVKEREAYETKRRAEALEAQIKSRDEAEARFKQNPFEALKAYGHTLESAVRGEVEGKYKAPSAEQLAIDGTKSELQQLREQLDAFKAERDQATQQYALTQRAKEIGEVFARDDVAEKVPFLAAMPWAAQHIAEYALKNPGADVDDYAVKLDAQIARESESLTSDRVLKKLLANEATKSRVMALLGITKPAETPAQQAVTGKARGNGPAAIPSSVASEPGTRKTPSRAVTDAERKQNAVRAVMARRAAGQ